MPDIEVEQIGGGPDQAVFSVGIADGRSRSRHVVTVAEADRRRLAGGRLPSAELVRRSFEFLLEREPPGSILAEFDLTVIAKYYPEYDRAMSEL